MLPRLEKDISEIHSCCVYQQFLHCRCKVAFHWMNRSQVFIHSWVISSMNTINKTVTNICIQILFVYLYFYFGGLISGSGISGSHAKHIFTFVENCQNVFQNRCTISLLSVNKSSRSSTFSTLDVVNLFNFSYSIEYGIVLHSGFQFFSLVTSDVEHFSCSCWLFLFFS